MQTLGIIIVIIINNNTTILRRSNNNSIIVVTAKQYTIMAMQNANTHTNINNYVPQI